MLSGVSKFLFGYSSAAETTNESQEVDLKTHVTDEDWILVDTESKVATPTESHPTAAAAAEASLNGSCKSADTAIVTSAVSENGDAGSSQDETTLAVFHFDTDSDESPLPRSPEILCFFPGCPSDSWIMDPPPCFTASLEGCREASVLHTPMENLLIEHPSMSVYDSFSHINSDGEDSDNTDNEGDDDEPQNELEEERRPSTPFEEVAVPIMPLTPVTRPTSTAARPAPCPQNPAQTYRMVLQRQTYTQTRYLNKKSLNRSNKIHEYSHLGKHQRHRARYQCPSGRMNGRLGQRRAY